MRFSRFIDLVEIDLLERVADDDARERITNEINTKPVEAPVVSTERQPEGTLKRRRRRPRMSAEQAQQIAEMADKYDKEVTGGR